MANLPLLIKGYNTDLNNTINSLPGITSTSFQLQNVFDTGRGDVMYIDCIETGRPLFYASDTGLIVTVLISGVQVIINANSGDFAPYANPGNYFITPLKQPGGQTLSLQIVGSIGNVHGLQLLAYYANPYDTAEYRAKIYTSKLKRRWQNSTFNVTAQQKGIQSQTFTVPVGNGNVCGVELLGYLQNGANVLDLPASTISMFVNGVSIFENVVAIYGHNTCSRPQIFPVKINPGDTFYFVADTSQVAAAITNLGLGARLYFDESNE